MLVGFLLSVREHHLNIDLTISFFPTTHDVKFILKDIIFLTDLLLVLHRLTSDSPVTSLGTQCSPLCTLSQPQAPVPGASLG